MQLRIEPGGAVRCLYSEAMDLTTLGSVHIQRASQVEPDAKGHWWAQIIHGPSFGPFAHRSQALAAETAWLEQHWLGGRSG